MSNWERILAVVVYLPLAVAVWFAARRFLDDEGWSNLGIMAVVGMVHYHYLRWIVGRWRRKVKEDTDNGAG